MGVLGHKVKAKHDDEGKKIKQKEILKIAKRQQIVCSKITCCTICGFKIKHNKILQSILHVSKYILRHLEEISKELS